MPRSKFALCSAPRSDNLGIDWEAVTARGRDALVGLTYRNDRIDVTDPVGVRRLSEGGLSRWVSESPDGRAGDHSVAVGSVSPLVRSGLLAASEADDGLLVLTAKGCAICEAYWRRRTHKDVSLPTERIRT